MLTTAETDRRQHQRYDIDSGGFALLRSNDTEVLGSIKDISAGGLSVSHIDDNEEIDGLSKISINLISEKICSKAFNGRSMWSKREEDDFTTAMVKMKRCGIEFGRLNDEMQVQLNTFIASINK